ncbi:MAG: tRNA (guanosine(37)-N1)-methyltransferase TrmD [Candidatus Levybacteria bacterium RIFOXYC1_FULL_40_10]|nr:MAG: tRNA (guanosine(37)-N1)-methyltransferase TrmD [Candidatus Levybacteria bacterium RIFOXYC1_FULL_40_10]
MTISIITLFPQMFEGPFSHSIIKRALNKNLLEIKLIDLRSFGIGKHKTVDDKPYGGGAGMILRFDVLKKAIDETRDKTLNKSEEKVILMDASGKTFNQKNAERLSKLKHLIIICGHYEGVDARVRNFIDEEISVGDFILTGGEIPAILVTDAVARYAENVLKKGVIEAESFSGDDNSHLEYPQYTRPDVFEKLSVPKILREGNHGKIAEWKKEASKKRTEKLRPDLL